MIIGQINESTDQDITELFGGTFEDVTNSHNVNPSGWLVNTAGPALFAHSLGPYICVEAEATTATPGAIGVKGTGLIGVQGVTTSNTAACGPGVLGVGNARGVDLQG